MLTGTPASCARCTSAAGTGPPPVSAQRSAAGRSRPPSSSRVSVVATRLTRVTSSLAQRVQHPVHLEAFVHHRARPVDRRAQQDREAADVRERQRAQPTLAPVETEGHGRAEGAPQQVRVAQLDRARRRARPGRVDHHGDRVEIVLDRAENARDRVRRRAAPRRSEPSPRRCGRARPRRGAGPPERRLRPAAGMRAAPARTPGRPAARSPRARPASHRGPPTRRRRHGRRRADGHRTSSPQA